MEVDRDHVGEATAIDGGSLAAALDIGLRKVIELLQLHIFAEGCKLQAQSSKSMGHDTLIGQEPAAEFGDRNPGPAKSPDLRLPALPAAGGDLPILGSRRSATAGARKVGETTLPGRRAIGSGGELP